eukprot:353422-Chlamydomonas_euryale.AAC.1
MAMVRPPTLSVPALAAGETTSRFKDTVVRFPHGNCPPGNGNGGLRFLFPSTPTLTPPPQSVGSLP